MEGIIKSISAIPLADYMEPEVEVEEEVIEKSLCEIQWHEESPDSRKFTFKNFERLDGASTKLMVDNKLNLAITKKYHDDKIQIIQLSSPRKVRTLYSIANDKPNYMDYGNNTDLQVASKVTPLHLSARNIKTISQPGSSSSEPTRKISKILNLKSLSFNFQWNIRGWSSQVHF